MMRRVTQIAVMVLIALAMVATPVWADGIIIPIPRPPRPPEPIKSLAIKYHRVTVEIDDQVATTHVDQVFINELAYDIEGDYIFPLPETATISEFAMWVDGQKLEAQVLERDEAQRIYEEIVRQRRDPALLEYVGRNAFRARIFPIPARGEKRVEISYTEVLSREGDLAFYRYPLNTEKFSTKPLEQVSVSVRARDRQAIGDVYSPSHDVVVSRGPEGVITINYEENGVIPNRDFLLYYSIASDRLGANVISYKSPGEDGYFLMLLSPGQGAKPSHAIAKDVHFVVDVSGSMRGEKLLQAKNAARYVLDNLNPDDRFNILAFSTSTRAFADRPQPLSERTRAHAFVDELQAGGGTNIDRAMEQILRQTERGRPQMVVFLTDGLATEGETDTAKILGRVSELAKEDVRIFAFGVGYDVNTILLDTMAQEQNGASSYVRPDEDIERVLSAFYDKISLPVLTDVHVDFGLVQAEDVYPYPLPDLFAGEQLVVLGRYRQPGDATIVLRGMVNGEPYKLALEDVRFRANGGLDMIPRLWATRKIGYLLTQIRLKGADRELIDEVVSLSVRHGIVTPYTSFLVDETEDALSTEGRRAMVDKELSARAASAPSIGVGGGGAPLAYGQAAVEQSMAHNQMRMADQVAEPSAEAVRTVGSKAFVERDGIWIDTSYEAQMRTERIAMGSNRYWALLRENSELGAFFALGERLIVIWDGQAYQIDPPGSAESNPESAPTATPQPSATIAVQPTAIPATRPSVTPQPSAAPDIVVPVRTPLWRLILQWLDGALG